MQGVGGGGGVLSELPSVVGVWIFCGTTQYKETLGSGYTIRYLVLSTFFPTILIDSFFPFLLSLTI